MGKSKVAPVSGYTIQRLELCAAVLGVHTARIIQDNIDVEMSAVKYYTDSKVVLVYINNAKRRFYNYAANRVEKIRKHSDPDQWNYVPTNVNPADIGSRGIKANDLQNSMWLVGPEFFKDAPEVQDKRFDLIDPDMDTKVRKDVQTFKTCSYDTALCTKRFKKFSSFSKLVNHVEACSQFIQEGYNVQGWHICSGKETEDATNLIIKELQRETYTRELTCLDLGKSLPKDSVVVSLNLFIGDDGLLHVGGRLSKANLKSREKHPVILPNKNHFSTLLVTNSSNIKVDTLPKEHSVQTGTGLLGLSDW